jgi:hypothetical protein
MKLMTRITRRKTCIFLGHTISGVLVGIVSGSLFSCQSKHKSSDSSQAAERDIEITNESGNFLDEVNRLKTLALPKESNLYQPPTTNDLKNFRLLAKALIVQDIKGALNKANLLNYELVRFIDTPTQQVLYGLREKRVRDRPLRGWGSYFINAGHSADALVEVPHNANGAETADVCNAIQSIFQEVHKAWVLSNNKTWQIHGFSLSTKADFPSGTQSILSDGRGTVSTEISDLSQRMKARGFQSYMYNRLSASAPLNLRLNQGVAGKTFSHLGGTHNVQGIYCHSVGTPFTHIELEQSIRYSPTNRDVVARVIADFIQAMS